MSNDAASNSAEYAAESADSVNAAKGWIQSNTQIVHVMVNENQDIIVDILNNNTTPLSFSQDEQGSLIVQG